MECGVRTPELPDLPRVPLPVVLDEAGVVEFFGVRPTLARRIMRNCPRRIDPDDIRKVWVYSEDVLAWFEANTVVS